MKKGENVDGNTKPDISSMKSAKIMDGKFKMKFPSMKKPEIMDEKLEMKLSSMKSAENVDENTKLTRPSMKKPRKCHCLELSGLMSYLRPLAAIIFVRVSLNSAAAASCSTVRCIL